MIDLKYQILVDNDPAGENFACEHGYSVFIEYNGIKILLDTGKSDAFLRNAALCGIDPAAADIVVLSHGHYDHGDGFGFLGDLPITSRIYMHAEALTSGHYSLRDDGRVYDISLSSKARNFFDRHSRQIVRIQGATEIAPNIWLTGSIGRNVDYENFQGKFFKDPERKSDDFIFDDISLWIEDPSGLYVFTGCCHSGIVNTLQHIRQISGRNDFRQITGGLHLLSADEDRLSKTKEFLSQYGDIKLELCHCTGAESARYITG